MRIGDPEHGVIDCVGIRTAAEVGQVDQTLRRDAVFCDPLECRSEVRTAATCRMELDRLTLQELFRALHGGVTVDHVNAFGFYVDGNGVDLASKLLEFG